MAFILHFSCDFPTTATVIQGKEGGRAGFGRSSRVHTVGSTGGLSSDLRGVSSVSVSNGSLATSDYCGWLCGWISGYKSIIESILIATEAYYKSH